jgi:aconitate hydratase
MTFIDTYKTFSKIDVNGKKYIYFDLNKLANHFKFNLSLLPFSIKILLENLIRNEDGKLINADMINSLCSQLTNKDKSFEIAFSPTRVLMQDFTGVPAVADLAAMRDALKAKNIDPNKINPLSRVDLVIDHSVMVDEFGNAAAYDKNVRQEFMRNTERYEFLKWGQNTFDNFFLVPPGAGICHQVNLENIAKTIWVNKTKDGDILYPDSVVGTDSHTTMVNALSVLGWGVGGIEAEAAMLGQPISMNTPKVLGFNISGSLNEGITATDLVLTITEKLRHHGVVGKFVEFIGIGLKNLTLADRATISNMAPEYGATCGFFPTDNETINYLRLTGKDDHHLAVVESYAKKQQLWYDEKNPQEYDELITFDLNEVKASIAGPKRPQDKILLQDVPESFSAIVSKRSNSSREAKQLESGDIVIAAITSCTNTSNPNVMIAAGLVAKKAVEFGLTVKPWVKTSLAPGSKVVSDYLEKSNLSTYLDAIGFNLVGYGCTTCIGNSGSLNEWVSNQIIEKKLSVCSVLSGNRNFEGRIHQEIMANYLASPPLVVVFALAGSIYVNIQSDVIGISKDGKEVLLKDLWPTTKEIESVLQTSLSSDMFLSRYKEIYKGDNNWAAIKTIKNNTYEWSDTSTYIKQPPFFTDARTYDKQNIIDARILALLADSVTTDHISPAGAIREDSPAGCYLLERQISKQNFNSYGSRRGNHEIMMRGTFANIRIRNEIVPNIEGGITHCFVNGKDMSIYEAAMEYAAKEIPLIVIAGKEYGTGSSRDWAAKGTRLLGVRAVIAESFERIHRSNLIGMGVLPFEFINGENRKSLELDGSEKLTILDVDKIIPSKIIQCKISSESKNYNINLKCRIDTLKELDYYKSGGILQYVLNSNIDKNS